MSIAIKAHPNRRPRKRSVWSIIVRDKYLYLLALPGSLFFLAFKYLPMWGIVIAFQDYSPFAGILKSDWVGFDHFVRLFNSQDFGIIFRNTLVINLMLLVFFFPLPIILSLLLNELRSQAYKRIIQSIVYMPHFLSWVIVVGLTTIMLSASQGLVNQVVEALGREKVAFLTEPKFFWIILTAQSIWKDCGWGTIIFLAAMSSVDPQLYDAAKIDGASRLRQMWHVTLPGIRNVTVILLILQLGALMDVGFEQVYLMYNGAVSEVAEVFDTYVYKVGVLQGQFGFSTAAGLFKSVVGMTLVVAANYFAKKVGEEGVF